MLTAPNINEEVVERAAQIFAELFVMQFDNFFEQKKTLKINLPSVRVVRGKPASSPSTIRTGGGSWHDSFK